MEDETSAVKEQLQELRSDQIFLESEAEVWMLVRKLDHSDTLHLHGKNTKCVFFFLELRVRL